MTTDIIAAKVADLQDGQMKEIAVGDDSILLVRINGEFHAIGAWCTHAGAQLAKGVLCNCHLRCPWHHAVFDAATGDPLEPPAFDGLPQFDLRIEDDNVIVTVPEPIPEQRSMAMAKYDPRADDRCFVILGTGAAGASAAETLRQRGFAGRIVMVTQEDHLPYDRTPLSKTYLKAEQDKPAPTLRSEEFYNAHGIEILTGYRVNQVDVSAKTVSLDGSGSMKFDKLLLATGATARKPAVRGADLPNVFTLRSLDDCDRIRRELTSASRAVVVGAGFIGMETAATLRERGLAVTVVDPQSVPFERSLGSRIGRMIQAAHEQQGVCFQLGAQVARFDGADRVEAVVLRNGQRLEADVVIVGIGVEPATDLLEGVRRNPDGSVTVDQYLRLTSDVYAAGDIARFPDWRGGQPIRIEHWRLAEQHGRLAACNMVGTAQPFKAVPFFWSNQYKLRLRYAGHAARWDDLIVHGETSECKFIAFYVNGDRVLAALGCKQDRQLAAAAELMQADQMPSRQELSDGPVDLVQRIKHIKAPAL